MRLAAIRPPSFVLALCALALHGHLLAADDAPLVHLRFEDRAAKALDSSGHNSKTKLLGKAGFARGPDGSSAIALVEGGSLEISNPKVFASDTQHLTVAFWVIAANFPPNTRLVQKGNQDEEWRISINQKGEFMWVLHGKTAGAVYVKPPPQAKWTHVAAVYGDGIIRLYFDGKQVAQRQSGPEKVGFSRQPITLGAGWNRTSQPVEPFDGRFDDFRFYNRALSADEVAALARRN